MAAHIETQPMPTARLGEPTELILDAGEGNRNPTPEEQVLLGIGPEHLPMPSTVLPYRYQDDYHREISDVEHRVAVLDNGRIRATFLLDLGGRLWTLRDLEGDRELLHQPDAIRIANLALRNAWFAGGVEWNLGMKGHWGLTCEPVSASVISDDHLRMWAFERLTGLTWRMDVWLPDGSGALFVHTTLTNPTAQDIPAYWWSNMAVPQTHGTRVLFDGEHAFHFGYAFELGQVDVPMRDGRDVSYPARHSGAGDYFYLHTTDHPWIAAVEADGVGLGQASTARLAGRKMFTWGNTTGGLKWQEWLSGDRAYAEIQAGLASTQLEHLRLPAGETWRFTESYRPIHVQDPGGPWTKVVDSARQATLEAAELDRAHHHLTALEDLPVTQIDGDDPWGALEVEAGHRAADPATPFRAGSMGPEQEAWLALALHGRLDPLLQRSALVSPQWRAALEGADEGWLRDLLLGHVHLGAGQSERARELWEASIAMHPTADAHRALGLTSADPADRAAHLATASHLEPDRARITVEAATALLEAGRADEALRLIEKAPVQHPRLDFLAARAHVALGNAEAASASLARPLVLPDLREGEMGLDDLWHACQELLGTNEPLPAHYDFGMQGSQSGSGVAV